jgi:hypothetical protein
MKFYIVAAAAVAIAAFVLGWLTGFRKSTQAHGWNGRKTDQKNNTDPPPSP